LPADFQKQLRLVQNPLPDRRRTVPPGGVQLSGFACRTLTPGEDHRHPPAVLAADLGHRRQELHRQMGCDLTGAHALLDLFRQQFEQGQTARHPTRAAIEAASQIFHTVPEAPLQFLQQPAFLQRCPAPGHAHGMFQEYGLGLVGRPDHGFDGVAAQLLQRLDALIAVDHQVAIQLVGHRHHHDGNLLTVGSQRSQQALVPSGTSPPPVLPASIELVKLQLHGPLVCRDSVCGRRGQVFLKRGGKWIGNPRGIKQIQGELVFRGAQQ